MHRFDSTQFVLKMPTVQSEKEEALKYFGFVLEEWQMFSHEAPTFYGEKAFPLVVVCPSNQ